MYIDDCTRGTQLIAESEIHEPINLGSSELVTIDQLVDIVEDIAGAQIEAKLPTGCSQGSEWAEQRQHEDQLNTLGGSPRFGCVTAWQRPTNGLRSEMLVAAPSAR